MKNAAVIPAPGPGADAEALIKEARRRQRKRRTATAGAAAAVLAAVLGVVVGSHGAGGPGPSRPRPGPGAGHSASPQVPGPIPKSLDASVLMWAVGGQAGAIDVDNLRTGKEIPATVAVDPGEFQPIMVAGGWIVYVTNITVRATNARTGKTHVLGKALAFAPSAARGDVWLEYGSYRSSVAAVTVRSVPLAGGPAGPLITLPRGTQLVAGTDAGMLLEPRGGEVGGPFWLWTPGTAPRPLPHSSSAEGFDVTHRLVAYGTGCANPSTAQNSVYAGNFVYYACRTLRVFDVGTGRLRSFPAPGGTKGWAPTHGGNWAWSRSEIAPSGKLMAAEAVVAPLGQGIARVFVLHLTGPEMRATAVPSSAAFLLSVTAWSPRDSWLFYQGPGQHMWAYQVTTGRVRSSKTTCCQYAVMAAIKSPPG
jgi:hypothetical protein